FLARPRDRSLVGRVAFRVPVGDPDNMVGYGWTSNDTVLMARWTKRGQVSLTKVNVRTRASGPSEPPDTTLRSYLTGLWRGQAFFHVSPDRRRILWRIFRGSERRFVIRSLVALQQTAQATQSLTGVLDMMWASYSS